MIIGANAAGRPSDASAAMVKGPGEADVIDRRGQTAASAPWAQALDVKPAGKVVACHDKNERTRGLPLVRGDSGAGARSHAWSAMPACDDSDPDTVVAACSRRGAGHCCCPLRRDDGLAGSGLAVGEVLTSRVFAPRKQPRAFFVLAQNDWPPSRAR